MDAEFLQVVFELSVGLTALTSAYFAALLLRWAVARAAVDASSRRLQALEGQLHGMAREVLALKVRTSQRERD
jgi:hypothetical protein